MNLLYTNFLASFDDITNDDDDTTKGAADSTVTNQATGSDDQATNDRKFTQIDMDNVVQTRLAKDRKRRDEEFQTQVKSLEDNYKGLLQSKNLEDQDRERLEQQLADLRKQHRTKEQQLTDEKKRLQEEWEEKYDGVKSKATEWETRYTESTITQALQSAAIANDAYNPQQIIIQLQGQTKLIEQMDSAGKPTGKLVPMVEMIIKNKDSGASEQLQMTPEEAVEYLAKNPAEYGNYFRHNIRSGIGASASTGGGLTGDGTVDHTKLTDDQWFKLRKDNPEALGMDYRRT